MENNALFSVKKFGWTMLRFEKWTLTVNGTTNNLYAVKVLFFKFFISKV